MKDRELLKVIAEKIITAEDISKIDLGVNIGTLRWTGWKGVPWSIEKHAQLVLLNIAGKRTNFYVDIPSMHHGEFHPGSSFDIGYQPEVSKRMFPGDTTLEMAREWFKEAVMILIDDVLTAYPEVLNPPYEEEKECHN